MPETEEDARAECPVCYEVLNANSRTLSCGHVFCHDCLARTLLSGAGQGPITRKSITCPVCRHLTFISERAGGKGTDYSQVIEVPPISVGCREDQLGNYVLPCTWLPGVFTRTRAVTPIQAPQIFTISGEGRPMEDGEQVSVLSAAGESLARRGRPANRFSACGVLSLLLILASLAVASAILRWILLEYL
ncbi:RING finger protein 222-like [Brienomyrus brachyistius]|uniref:RING finger protein 222-like n=1 Tax=Brienomyrus brachyistius TaxID=42636 RepID=UPI0020B228F8|nr:RING finger protein 222-like [Brienomyrus brachyistius]